MVAVAADLSRNLLELKFAGRVTPDELRSETSRLQEALQQVKPGFSLLTDLTELEEMQLACRPLIDVWMDQFNQRGISKVIRVIPDPGKDIGFGIMALFHYRQEVRMVTCETLAEARHALNNPGRETAP